MLNKQSAAFSIIFIALFVWNVSLQIKSNDLAREIYDVRNISEWAEDRSVLNEELATESNGSIDEKVGDLELQILNLQSQITKNENLITVSDTLLRHYVEDLNTRQTEHMYDIVKIYHP